MCTKRIIYGDLIPKNQFNKEYIKKFLKWSTVDVNKKNNGI